MVGDRMPVPQKSCVRAYSLAALNAERCNLLSPPVESATDASEGEAESPCARSIVLSARVATIVRRGPISDSPKSLAVERAASRRGMASPARISVCLSEFTLTVGF